MSDDKVLIHLRHPYQEGRTEEDLLFLGDEAIDAIKKLRPDLKDHEIVEARLCPPEEPGVSFVAIQKADGSIIGDETLTRAVDDVLIEGMQAVDDEYEEITRDE